MEKWMFYLQKYNEILTEAAAFLLALIALMLLIGILRQIKRLNKGLGDRKASCRERV